MERVFIASSFKSELKELIRDVEAVVQSLEIRPVIGDDLGGGSITAEVTKLIQSCDGLVALMMPVKKLKKGFAPTTWVIQELQQARTLGLKNIAIVDKRVVLDGAYQDYERIAFDPDRPLPAFMKLLTTLAKWKRESGQLIQVTLMPDTLWEHLNENAVCEFRTYDQRGRPSLWKRAEIVPEVGGKIAYLSGVPNSVSIEFRARIGGETWSAPAQQPRGVVLLRKEAQR